MATAREIVDVVVNIEAKYTKSTAFAQLAKEQRDLDINNQKLVASLNAVGIANDKYSRKAASLASQLGHSKISQEEYDRKMKEAANTLLTKTIPALQSYNRVLNDNDRILSKQRVPGALSAAAVTPEERAGARRFSTTVPTLRRELAEIEAYNKALKSNAAPAKNFNNALQDQEKRAEGAEKAMRGLFSAIAKVATIYYLFRSATDILRDTLDAILDFTTASRSLGQVLGINSEQASAFVFQAQQLGVSTDTVTEAYRTFSDRLGRATGLFGEQNRGSRQMSAAMNQLGVTMVDTNGKIRPLNDILKDTHDAIQELGPSIETTAIATALFGQRSDEMLDIILQGSEGLGKASERARELGFSLTNIEAKQLRDASVAMNDLQKAGQSVALTLTKAIAPALPDIADVASRVAISVNQTFLAIGGAARGAGRVVKEIFSIGDAFQNLFDTIKNGGSLFDASGFNIFKAFIDEVNEFAGEHGFKLGAQLGKGLFTRLPEDDTSLTDLFPGTTAEEEEAKAEKLSDILADYHKNVRDSIKDHNERVKDLVLDYQRDTFERVRDFNNNQLREEQDFLTERANAIRDFNLRQSQEQEDFALSQRHRLEDFLAGRSDDSSSLSIDRLAEDAERGREAQQAIEDFYRDMLRDSEDFFRDSADRTEDFNRNQEDRLIAHNRKVVDAQTRANDQIESLEERHQKSLADIQQKWDDILLRLRVGGDVESINQAQLAASQAIADQANLNQEETDELVDKLADEAALEESRFQEDQARQLEEFQIDQARRREEEDINTRREMEDFERERQRKLEEDAIKRQDQEQARAIDDALALAEFERENRQRIEQFELQRQQERDNFNIRLADEKAEFDLERQRRIEDFRTETLDRDQAFRDRMQKERDNLRDRLKELRDGFMLELAELNIHQAAVVSAVSQGQNRQAIARQQGNASMHNQAQVAQQTGGVIQQTWAHLASAAEQEFARISRAIQDTTNDLLNLFGIHNGEFGGMFRPVSRAYGGSVPGPLGSPQFILAHGGERIVPPASPQYYSNVRHGDQIRSNTNLTFNTNSNHDPQIAVSRAARQLRRAASLNRSYSR